MADFNKIKYNNEYNKQSYDRINLMTEKGKKSQWAEKAKAAGLSLNAYITRAVDSYAGIEDFTKVEERAKEEARREVLSPTRPVSPILIRSGIIFCLSVF